MLRHALGKQQRLYKRAALAVFFWKPNGMDAFLAHAIVDPSAGASANTREARAARALSLQILGPAGERERPLFRTWRARTGGGKQVGLLVLVDAATDAERDRFAECGERLCAAGAIAGTLRVYAVAPSRDAIVVDLWTTGCATDLPALLWSPRRRLEFARGVAQSLDALHRAGFVHGCLCLDNVLLDDDLQPVLAEAGLVSVPALIARRADASSYAAFVAPEVKSGAAPDVRSDLWSAGRMIERLVAPEEVPQVADLVGRCLSPLAQSRFSNAGELVAAIDAVVAVLPKGERSHANLSPLPEAPRDRQSRTGEAPRASLAGVVTKSEPPRWSAGPAIGGAMAIGIATLAAFFLGLRSAGAITLVEGLMAAAVAAATWSVPALPNASARTRAVARLALALSCAMLVVVVDPLTPIRRAGALRRLQGSETARRAGIAEIVEQGRDFRGLSLVGLDFSGLDLTGADFRAADLSHADFSGARLWAAQLEGAALDGTRLDRANLEDATLDQAFHARSAECDAATRLPRGWRCEAGRPLR
jgi:hypothetical protein